MDVAAYVRQLRALLPRGAAWTEERSSRLTALLTGLADELVRVDRRGVDLINEADPRTTYEMLADWERVYGLPDPCDGATPSVAQRRASLVAKVISRGGQSRAYFIALAAALGFEVTITEFRPYDVTSPCDDPMCGEEWAFVWQVNAPLDSVPHVYAVNDPVNEPLASWGSEVLECVIEALKPAHTHVQFAYS